MLTKGKISALKAFADKKERNKRGVFLVEGEKSVAELLVSDLTINELFLTHDFAKKYSVELKDCEKRHAAISKWIKPQIVEVGELNKISNMESLKNPCSALAVVSQIAQAELDDKKLIEMLKTEKVLILDDIRDPGNMGTIIRLADWYGVKNIIASIGTVDIYNPKTISASMGSFSRIHVFYKNIIEVAQLASKNKVELIASTLKGKNANEFVWPKQGALIIGNEANGVSNEVLRETKNQITLPSFGKAESLNASMACGILLDRWIR